MSKTKINFYIITLFPDSIKKFLGESIIGRAQKKGLIKIKTVDLRKYGIGKWKKVDDKAFGGGAGMVLRVDVIAKAIKDVKKGKKSPTIILLTPQGKTYNQKIAKKLSKEKNIILIAGHYEGFDERIRDFVDEEISLGDFILTGGEIPAVAIVDSVARLIPEVLGKKESIEEESFSIQNTKYKIQNLLEYPHYAQPREFAGKNVPEVLLSGDHQKIKKWREEEAIKRTKKRRPDLLI